MFYTKSFKILKITILDSERSDKCIYFTMMCFFLSVYSITCRNNFSISNFAGVVSDGKMNILGAVLRLKLLTKSIFFYGCNSKTNHFIYLNISPIVYITFIYIHVGTLENLKNHKIVSIKLFKFWCIQAIKTTFYTNHWKLYPRLRNHLRSESFFYNFIVLYHIVVIY
ncbi:Uncharacterized protein FWK35_00001737 [Aphis craccivora]|uniref:Uncharacterized protein n=1 Tax=Aphis craccivora TaxID=307492 RepID=A0A6G0ZIA4_APHCR|nr:Uncharacterized protein FWK35_00001737 [Aphis craccivora]